MEGYSVLTVGERREIQREGVRTLYGKRKRIREEKDRRKSPVSSGTFDDPQDPQKKEQIHTGHLLWFFPSELTSLFDLKV